MLRHPRTQLGPARHRRLRAPSDRVRHPEGRTEEGGRRREAPPPWHGGGVANIGGAPWGFGRRSRAGGHKNKNKKNKTRQEEKEVATQQNDKSRNRQKEKEAAKIASGLACSLLGKVPCRTARRSPTVTQGPLLDRACLHGAVGEEAAACTGAERSEEETDGSVFTAGRGSSSGSRSSVSNVSEADLASLQQTRKRSARGTTRALPSTPLRPRLSGLIEMSPKVGPFSVAPEAPTAALSSGSGGPVASASVPSSSSSCGGPLAGLASSGEPPAAATAAVVAPPSPLGRSIAVPFVRKGAWRQVAFEDYGFFAFDANSGRLNAHCICPRHVGRHARCHTDKVTTASTRKGAEGQGRPLGFLAAWLMDSSLHSSKEDHQASKRSLGSEDSYEKRLEARMYLRILAGRDPDVQALFAQERPATAGEDAMGGEPLSVPHHR